MLDDLASLPGHLQPLGTGRPIAKVAEVQGFPEPDGETVFSFWKIVVLSVTKALYIINSWLNLCIVEFWNYFVILLPIILCRNLGFGEQSNAGPPIASLNLQGGPGGGHSQYI